MTDRGVLYIVWGDRHLREAAAASAAAHSQGLATAVVTDDEVPDGVFDHVIHPPQDWDGLDGYYRKILAFHLSPFQCTLYTDSDLLLVGDVSLAFETIRRHGLTLSLAPNQVCRLGNPTREYIQYQGGLIGFRAGVAGDDNKGFGEDWLRIREEFGFNWWDDEGALSVAASRRTTPPAVLPSVFNLFEDAKIRPQPIRGWHGRAAPKKWLSDYAHGPLTTDLPAQNDPTSLVAPAGTADLPVPWEGRAARKPWQHQVTAVIPHLGTPLPLRVGVELLRLQTERPYFMVMDTGSERPERDDLEALRDDDLEVHYLLGHGYGNASEPVAVALDAALALCRTEYLYTTHTDVFVMRRDLLEDLVKMCGPRTPAVGYGMSDRSWATEDWKDCLGHQCLMLHVPTVRRLGLHWNMAHGYELAHWQGKRANGWPDTETCFFLLMRERGVKPVRLGQEVNYQRFTDHNVDHSRSFTCGGMFGNKRTRAASDETMNTALADAVKRLKDWGGPEIIPPSTVTRPWTAVASRLSSVSSLGRGECGEREEEEVHPFGIGFVSGIGMPIQGETPFDETAVEGGRALLWVGATFGTPPTFLQEPFITPQRWEEQYLTHAGGHAQMIEPALGRIGDLAPQLMILPAEDLTPLIPPPSHRFGGMPFEAVTPPSPIPVMIVRPEDEPLRQADGHSKVYGGKPYGPVTPPFWQPMVLTLAEDQFTAQIPASGAVLGGTASAGVTPPRPTPSIIVPQEDVISHAPPNTTFVIYGHRYREPPWLIPSLSVGQDESFQSARPGEAVLTGGQASAGVTPPIPVPATTAFGFDGAEAAWDSTLIHWPQPPSAQAVIPTLVVLRETVAAELDAPPPFNQTPIRGARPLPAPDVVNQRPDDLIYTEQPPVVASWAHWQASPPTPVRVASPPPEDLPISYDSVLSRSTLPPPTPTRVLIPNIVADDVAGVYLAPSVLLHSPGVTATPRPVMVVLGSVGDQDATLTAPPSAVLGAPPYASHILPAPTVLCQLQDASDLEVLSPDPLVSWLYSPPMTVYPLNVPPLQLPPNTLAVITLKGRGG